jgi:TRAP-type C4-dicarboxylate transport system permease small subunit
LKIKNRLTKSHGYPKLERSKEMELIKQDVSGLNKMIHVLDKLNPFNRWANFLGVAVLFLMVCLTFIDVIMRYIFNSPIKGVLEITEVMMVMAIFLAIAHTQNEKGHVSIDLVIARLKSKPKLILEFINGLLGLGLFIIMIWQSVMRTMLAINKNSMHSQYFPLPDAPFTAIVVLGCLALCLILIRDLLKLAIEAQQQRLRWYHWSLIFGVPITILILALFWMQPDLWGLSLPLVGLIGVIISLTFFLMGMPIAFALILTSFLFIGHIRGTPTALNIIGTDLYRTVGSYTWSVLPFFVMMGYLCFFAKFGEDLFFSAYKWVGHLRGGMAVATVGACTAFAAIVGDSVSATATMGAVAMPQMKKYSYDNRLSVGCIIGGASLGPIIPPSVVFILYGLLTNTSIGNLFVAGIIPGLLITLCFILIIFIWCRIKPDAGPSGPKAKWRERAISLKAGGPVLILFVVVIGGIYIGVITPTEGGAIGAMVAFILG